MGQVAVSTTRVWGQEGKTKQNSFLSIEDVGRQNKYIKHTNNKAKGINIWKLFLNILNT